VIKNTIEPQDKISTTPSNQIAKGNLVALLQATGNKLLKNRVNYLINNPALKGRVLNSPANKW